MTRGMEHYIRGMGLGVMVGCIVGVMGTCMLKKRKKGLKANAGRAMHAIGDLLENVTDMF